ncbi:succinate dehydrogenase assembly factor 2 [Roseivivax sp. THAF30]|jgi:antitoxin CptB|uniref:succinate dehydrogenase assembly factor 2 n=1 Tax=Roseivivax sp. THAF30 TaxID=2587852 RepID=UPI00126949B6|nr:succinate dehydrogenase assembly factor 2 [Roseivivax sp. THAF30]QFT64463.1 Flavinator of succinate dehydrogenase [Roseivivax sp. THAF30]
MIEESRNPDETREHRVKRLTMRSMRRGIKEMDLILMRFAAAKLAAMEEDGLDAYDALLSENDQDLYQWVTGQIEPPARHEAIVSEIRDAIAEGYAASDR